MGGIGTLAALALAALQAGVPGPACGCAQFAPASAEPAAQQAALSPGALTLRDFVLFSHRRIGADLIRKQGPYLDTLSAYFPQCADDALKLAWLRRILADASDTRVFAERLAQQYDSSRACPVPPQ
jgi:hypothetical protein